MKLSTALVFLASAACATAKSSIRNPNAKKALLSKARRLEDQNDDAQEEEEYEFLMNYSLKLIGCSGEKYQNPEDGEYEYSSVVVRMCPKDECDDELAGGCKSGYGDYVVGINTFVEAWLRDKEEDMQNDQDDQWNVNEFAECREVEVDNDADDQDADNEVVYYMGPTCGEDGDIKMGFFSDYTCTTVPEDVTFEDISNGWTMPYEDGGLVSTYCEGCAGYNDNGEYELSEMCGEIYESSSSKCETESMEYYSQYGKDESGCEYIAEAFPSTVAKGASKAGIIIMWIIIALLIVGGGFFLYTKWWMKRKQGSAGGLSSSDGVAA
jgi:hypothetical protein